MSKALPPPTAAAPQADLSQDQDACYLALKTRDARFDGRFFTGVTSTGIYCRPVCAVRAPRRENCRFFQLAAQAEQAGFRPCLRCRPELAPQALSWSTTDARQILAQAAARWLDNPANWPQPAGEPPAMERLAAHLGVSDRHLRRVFEAAMGVSPLQYLQTRRLLSAKQLLADTDLPITEVALCSGFSSLRRFNAAFVEHYGLNPSQWRRPDGLTPPGARQRAREVRLGFRPPYELGRLAAFFAQRRLDGVEVVEPLPQGLRLSRTLALPGPDGQPAQGWVQAEWDPLRHQVRLRTSEALQPCLPLLIRRVRQWLDLDADPEAIDAVLAPHFGPLQGLRVPGTLDGFELAVRAVLGQQVTVAAARTLTQRLVDRFGQALPPDPQTPAGLSRLFPAPQVLAGDGDAQALAQALGEIGIVRQRQQAVIALARAVCEGRLRLDGGAALEATLQALVALPGIGDWTARYIAMRALRWPDAFPAGDVVLQNALGTRHAGGSPRAIQQATEAASAAWRPWRSYAVIHLWAQAAPRPGPSARLPTSLPPISEGVRLPG